MTQKTTSQALRLSFEYFPSSNETDSERLWRAITKHAQFAPEFVSITFGAGGSNQERTLKTLERLANSRCAKGAGHLTTMGGTRDEVLNIAKAYRQLGIEHIVALRGDKPKGSSGFKMDPEAFQSSIELIEVLKERDFEISVGAYPEMHPDAKDAQSDIRYLKAKFDAGADRAITQFFFEKDHFLRFRDQTQTQGIDGPIIPGILPIENFEKMQRFALACGTHVPLWLKNAFSNAKTSEDKHILAVSIACDMIENLRQEGVEHVHFYTLNNPELCFDICTALGISPNPSAIAQVA